MDEEGRGRWRTLWEGVEGAETAMPMVRGVVRGFDAGAHTAVVQPLGSGAGYLYGVPVSREVAALAAGERVLLVMLDRHNSGDAVVVCRY